MFCPSRSLSRHATAGPAVGAVVGVDESGGRVVLEEVFV